MGTRILRSEPWVRNQYEVYNNVSHLQVLLGAESAKGEAFSHFEIVLSVQVYTASPKIKLDLWVLFVFFENRASLGSKHL